MQIVKAIDIEDALRIDLSEMIDATITATPPPDDLEPGTVCVYSLGGYEETAVSSSYDLSIDVWANTPGQSLNLALEVQGIVASLPIRTFKSGREYKTATANSPYYNPDANRPLLPRYTVAATVGIRGERF